MIIRVIQVQNFFEFQKNVTVEKLGHIKNPVEHKASVFKAKTERERERERVRGISNGGVRETKRKPLLINLMFNSNSNSWVSVFFGIGFLWLLFNSPKRWKDCFQFCQKQHCSQFSRNSQEDIQFIVVKVISIIHWKVYCYRLWLIFPSKYSVFLFYSLYDQSFWWLCLTQSLMWVLLFAHGHGILHR